MKKIILLAFMAATVFAEDKTKSLSDLQNDFLRQANELNSLQSQLNLSLTDAQKSLISQINQKVADLTKKKTVIEDACKAKNQVADDGMNCIDPPKAEAPQANTTKK